MNPQNFFAELKRRNVYKVAVADAVRQGHDTERFNPIF